MKSVLYTDANNKPAEEGSGFRVTVNNRQADSTDKLSERWRGTEKKMLSLSVILHKSKHIHHPCNGMNYVLSLRVCPLDHVDFTLMIHSSFIAYTGKSCIVNTIWELQTQRQSTATDGGWWRWEKLLTGGDDEALIREDQSVSGWHDKVRWLESGKSSKISDILEGRKFWHQSKMKVEIILNTIFIHAY